MCDGAGTQSCSHTYCHGQLWQLGCAVIHAVVWSGFRHTTYSWFEYKKNYKHSSSYITPSLESSLRFIQSASPVMCRLTSSFTCQLISVIVTTLIIHHSVQTSCVDSPPHSLVSSSLSSSPLSSSITLYRHLAMA